MKKLVLAFVLFTSSAFGFGIVNYPDNAGETVKIVIRHSANATTPERARKIMGRNFFGVEDAIRHLSANPSEFQIAALSKVPFSEATLKECKGTHILVAVFPMSLVDIRRHTSPILFNNDREWYDETPFAKDCGEVGWHLIRKTPVPKSLGKTLQEQKALLTSNEEIPNVRVMIYTIAGYHRATGKLLFKGDRVRCSDFDPPFFHVGFGNLLNDNYFDIFGWDDNSFSRVSLASARKPQ